MSDRHFDELATRFAEKIYGGAKGAIRLAVLQAGLAVTVQLRSLLTGNLRILDESEGLPALPSASIMLMRNPHSQSPVTEKLAEYIGEGFRL